MPSGLPTGLIWSERFRNHQTGAGHPESPERIVAIHQGIESLDTLHALEKIIPEEGDRQFAELNHQRTYVDRVKLACDQRDPYIDTFDNPIDSQSYQTALLATGAMISGVDSILKNRVKNAMALVRPPGHHAETSSAMGFCLFNNVAVAARYAQKTYSLDKIAIIDFDVHHGNGTQHSFENDASVLYSSVHRYPFYPGTGAKEETGWGDGLGTTINYPIEVGLGDDTFLDIVENSLADKVLAFRPDLVILSTGFDAHEYDPIGGMTVTTEGYRRLSGLLVKIADDCAGGRLLSVLEGGYHLQALTESVCAHLEELMKEES